MKKNNKAKIRLSENSVNSDQKVKNKGKSTSFKAQALSVELRPPNLDKTIDGFGELFRVLSFETIGTSSLQSRCLAGTANGTIIFVLPGSLDAVTTAWERLIAAQLNPDTRPCNLVQLLPRLREPS